MKYLHYEYSNLKPDDVLEIRLDGQANVHLLDDANFQRYQCRESFESYGGPATTSPCHLSPPRYGRWHLVIDSGGLVREVSASVRVIQFVNENGQPAPLVRRALVGCT